ncbi:hypothetical protein PQX77_002148 [Marasmius sp. AFHP31]|nr:hypothetical protein PQX77_002148 [Marasmius sp. AFHP31]
MAPPGLARPGSTSHPHQIYNRGHYNHIPRTHGQAPHQQHLGFTAHSNPRSPMPVAQGRATLPPQPPPQLHPAVDSSFEHHSVAPARVQWQPPTVIDNVDALGLQSFQPPPIPTPSPKQPQPSLPFDPPSASLGPSAINPANIPSSSQELLRSSAILPTSTQTPHPQRPTPKPSSRRKGPNNGSQPPATQSSRGGVRNSSRTPPPSSMGAAVQQHTQWSTDAPSASEPVPRPRMGKAEKALKAKVSDTEVVRSVTSMLDRQDEERRNVASELGISETRLRNLIGVHERFRSEKRPSAYNAAIHWKADQLNAGRAPNHRAKLEEVHIAVKEDAEMMAALETWKNRKEEKARKKAAQKGVEGDNNRGEDASDDDDDDSDLDDEDDIEEGDEANGVEGIQGSKRAEKRAHLAQVRRWFEALEVSKAEKFVGNRGSTKSVKKEGNIGVNRLNRVCENLSQKTGGLFWGFACRGNYNTAIVPGVYGTAPLDDFLMEKYSMSAYEFVSSVEAFACEQALHGTKAMTVEKMRIWVRSKLERSLREAAGDFTLTMKYKHYEALIVEPFKVKLVGWPDHIPFNTPHNLNNTLTRDLYNRLKSDSIKWVKMRPQEYQRWLEDFERRLEKGEAERPKRGERSDKGGTHNTGKTKSNKRSREPEKQSTGSKSKKLRKDGGSSTKTSKRKPSNSKTYKSAAIIDDSNDDSNDNEQGGDLDDSQSPRHGTGDEGTGEVGINGEELDDETRMEIEADPDAAASS